MNVTFIVAQRRGPIGAGTGPASGWTADTWTADTWTADTWTELRHLRGAEAVARYADGPLPQVPAITRNRYVDGVAWYAATHRTCWSARSPSPRSAPCTSTRSSWAYTASTPEADS